MPTIKHKFSTAKADGTDTTFVKPSNWNDDHDMETLSGAVYLGQDASGPGPVKEFPINHAATGDDMTIYTKAQVDAAIAAAVASITPGAITGDISASMLWQKNGWLQLNGQSIGDVGSSAGYAAADAHDLFVMFWSNIYGVSWPINGGRGASAEADWTALKTINLPDARGRVLGMTDENMGVNTLLESIGFPAGEQNHVLDVSQIPAHNHPITFQSPGQNHSFNNGGGTVGGGGVMWDSGAPLTIDNTGGGQGHNNVQPTLAVVFHIKV